MFFQRQWKRSDWRKYYQNGVFQKGVHENRGFLHVIFGRGCPEGQSGAVAGPDWGGSEIRYQGQLNKGVSIRKITVSGKVPVSRRWFSD